MLCCVFFFLWCFVLQNLEQQCVNILWETCAIGDHCVLFDTPRVKRQSCASTGWEGCARRVTSASFFMSTTWQRCLSVIFILSLVSLCYCSTNNKINNLFNISYRGITYRIVAVQPTNLFFVLFCCCCYRKFDENHQLSPLCLIVGECSNKECQYLHIDPESKIKDCPWYDRGFCKHGKSIYIVII